MSDFRTEQGAAQFWRKVDARIEKQLAGERKRQTGIVPDTAYGSVKFDAAGHAVWGGAGGGGGGLTKYGFLIGRDSTAQSIPSNTWTTITFDFEEYDTGEMLIGAGPSRTTINLELSSLLLINIDAHWDSTFSGTSALRLATSGDTAIYEDSRQIGSGSSKSWHNWCFLSFYHTSTHHINVYQNSGSAKDLYLYMTVQKLCAT